MSRTITRWIHIIFAISVAGYIYTPFEALPGFAWIVRWIVLPLVVVSGLWMWKGHLVRRLWARRA